VRRRSLADVSQQRFDQPRPDIDIVEREHNLGRSSGGGGHHDGVLQDRGDFTLANSAVPAMQRLA
jgi:hypothetical protein